MTDKDERTIRRKNVVNIVGSDYLMRNRFTLTCQKSNVADHKTCGGVEVDCLCPCHDFVL
jgi:hypothetical protein